MSMIDIKSLKCPACGAPYSAGQKICGFCHSALPEEPSPGPLAGVVASDGTEDIVDYYALFGLSVSASLGELEVQQAVLRTQQQYLLNRYLSEEQRRDLINDLEIGGWILSDERARREYDGILMSLGNGNFNESHLGTLSDLQRRAREALGLVVDQTSPQELLQQGIGYQALGMHREAAAVLRQAIEALPDSAEANYRYGQALLASDNPLSKGVHELRQAAASFKAAATIDASLMQAAAYEAFCLGLVARQEGQPTRAREALKRAVDLAPDLGDAWRALAALALQANDHDAVMQYCRQALICNAKDEQAYLLLVASCWRAGKHEWARDAAGRVATLRGVGWNADRVLREIV